VTLQDRKLDERTIEMLLTFIETPVRPGKDKALLKMILALAKRKGLRVNTRATLWTAYYIRSFGQPQPTVLSHLRDALNRTREERENLDAAFERARADAEDLTEDS